MKGSQVVRRLGFFRWTSTTSSRATNAHARVDHRKLDLNQYAEEVHLEGEGQIADYDLGVLINGGWRQDNQLQSRRRSPLNKIYLIR